jgi:hypothetical protein
MTRLMVIAYLAVLQLGACAPTSSLAVSTHLEPAQDISLWPGGVL